MLFLQDLQDLAGSARHPLPILISSQHLYETENVADKLMFLVDGAPEFYGPVGDIGSDRTENAFELAVAWDKSRLVAALGSLVIDCHRTGLHGFLLRTPLECTADDLLGAVVEKAIPLSYFRDVSRSTRTLFDSAKATT
ncbi:MAG: hypothetical protein KDC98_15220 [Planctomycetes bacterium]|nr:hypothetical protein [Planctomycetota bacterium]